jgi:hypothetical protein
MSYLINDRWDGDSAGGVVSWRGWPGKVQRKVCLLTVGKIDDCRAEYGSLSSLISYSVCPGCGYVYILQGMSVFWSRGIFIQWGRVICMAVTENGLRKIGRENVLIFMLSMYGKGIQVSGILLLALSDTGD